MKARQRARKRDQVSKEEIAALVGEAVAREKNLLKLEDSLRQDFREIFQAKRPGTCLLAGPIVDRAGAKQAEIVKLEELQRETRRKFIEAGQPDLARRFLSAPFYLRQLAGFLFRNEPLVWTLTRSQALKKPWSTEEEQESISALNYPKQFTLKRGSCENWLQPNEDWYRKFGRDLLLMWAVKKEADVTRRIKTADKRRQNVTDKRSIYRQAAIELAPMYSFEEWTCIFPDAAAAGDNEFIDEISASHRPIIREGRWPLPFPKEHLAIAIYWHGFHAVGSENKVPPLKHWSDEAAWQFVIFATGNSDLTQPNYQTIKARFELHREKPVLVGYAECSSDGMELPCRRR